MSADEHRISAWRIVRRAGETADQWRARVRELLDPELDPPAREVAEVLDVLEDGDAMALAVELADASERFVERLVNAGVDAPTAVVAAQSVVTRTVLSGLSVYRSSGAMGG